MAKKPLKERGIIKRTDIKTGKPWQLKRSYCGKKIIKYFKEKEEAIQYSQEWQFQIDHGQVSGKNPTLEEVFNNRVKVYLQNNGMKEQTAIQLRQKVKENILNSPVLRYGKIKVQEITADICEEWITELQSKGKKGCTSVNQIIGILNAVLKYAKEKRYVTFNQMENVFKPKGKGNNKHRALPKREKNIFLSIAEKDKNYRWYVFALLAFDCAGRSGELLALTWDDINFSNCTVSITRQYNKTTRTITDTKYGIHRVNGLTQKTIQALQDLKERTVGFKSKYIFQSSLREEACPKYGVMEEWLSRISKKCGFKVKAHDLRHTAITDFYYDHNGDLALTQRLAGHKNATTTQRYIHVNDIDNGETPRPKEQSIVKTEILSINTNVNTNNYNNYNVMMGGVRQ